MVRFLLILATALSLAGAGSPLRRVDASLARAAAGSAAASLADASDCSAPDAVPPRAVLTATEIALPPALKGAGVCAPGARQAPGDAAVCRPPARGSPSPVAAPRSLLQQHVLLRI
ncbi:MAG TPA: hypothetical protein PKC18_12050 [Lacipirellulaceae bacterium]|nr:hypothetical protein [Lacipirellulaceae bacterium]HMP08622.1 hypothetical protein [Lacipirellulaceae bacterium]